jgi:hypothetical protein
MKKTRSTNEKDENFICNFSRKFWRGEITWDTQVGLDGIIIFSGDRVTIDGVLDWLLDVFDSYTIRDNTSEITSTHRRVFLVTLLPTADFPLLPGSRPCGLATISLSPHTPAHCRLQTLKTQLFSTQDCLPLKSQSHVTTDDQSVSKSWIQAPSGSHDRTLISVWHLLFYRFRAPPLTRGWVCHLS